MSTRPPSGKHLAILTILLASLQTKFFPTSARFGQQHINTMDMRNDYGKITKKYHEQRRYEDKTGFRRTNG